MIVTISQPRYLPWLGYFHRLAVSDVFVYLDNVQYTPRDWENRNKVKTDQGWCWLTVPVKARYQALIPEVLVDNAQSWHKKHWQTIQTFYKAAPHFRAYAGALQEIYEGNTWDTLLDLNIHLTGILCGYLGITPPRFLKASDLKAPGKGSELILNLCRALGAEVYLSGSEGRNYLDTAAFEEANISLA